MKITFQSKNGVELRATVSEVLASEGTPGASRHASEDTIDQLHLRIINIHHSFLPAFAGANRYLRAFHPGVKSMGAAHFMAAGWMKAVAGTCPKDKSKDLQQPGTNSQLW